VAALARGTHARCIAFHPDKPLLAVVRRGLLGFLAPLL
jgi:hypothetical protein